MLHLLGVRAGRLATAAGGRREGEDEEDAAGRDGGTAEAGRERHARRGRGERRAPTWRPMGDVLTLPRLHTGRMTPA